MCKEVLHTLVGYSGINYGVMNSQKIESIISNGLTKHEWSKCIFIKDEDGESGVENNEEETTLLTFLKIVSTDTVLVFCFIQLLMYIGTDRCLENINANKQYNALIYTLSKEQIEQQCEEQGYIDLNYDSIWINTSKLDLQREYLLNNASDKVSFVLPLSLELHLKLHISLTPSNSVSSSCLLTLFSDFMKQILYSGSLLSNKLKNQDQILRKKDEVIQFLSDTVISLGGSQILNKWAPVGSNNYQNMQRYEDSDIEISPNVDVQWMEYHIQNMMNSYLRVKNSECTIDDDSWDVEKSVNKNDRRKKINPSCLESYLYSRKTPNPGSAANKVDELNVENNLERKSKKAKRSFGKVRVSRGA